MEGIIFNVVIVYHVTKRRGKVLKTVVRLSFIVQELQILDVPLWPGVSYINELICQILPLLGLRFSHS